VKRPYEVVRTETGSTPGTYGEIFQSPTPLWECPDCCCVVANRDGHDEWHARSAAETLPAVPADSPYLRRQRAFPSRPGRDDG
jgi:hypothetical protein